MEQTKKDEMLKSVNEKRNKMDAQAQERGKRKLRPAPLMKGTTVTFKVPEGKTSADLYVVVTEGINWDYITDSVGRTISCKQMFGALNNGMPYNGDDVDTRCDAFLEALEDAPGKTLSFRVEKVSISPSTNPDRDGTKYITWVPA